MTEITLFFGNESFTYKNTKEITFPTQNVPLMYFTDELGNRHITNLHFEVIREA